MLPERRLDLGESEEETSSRVDEGEESWRDRFWEGGSLEGGETTEVGVSRRVGWAGGEGGIEDVGLLEWTT